MRFPSVHLWVLAVTTAWVLMNQPARASEIAYEGFGPSFPIYANGGTGFTGPWTQGGFNAFASGYVPMESSLCLARLRTSGGSISGGAFSAINGAIRSLAQPLGQDNTTVYLSFLVQPLGTLNQGIFAGFFGLTLNGSLGNDLFIGKPGGGAEEQYVLEARGGFGQVASGTPTVVGRTALLVVKAEFRSGNDVFTLYTNPRPGDPEPAAAAVKADLDLGVVSRIGIYSTGAFRIDEIRIGTTYADVVPTSRHTRHHDSEDCGEGDREDDR
jgi:hypothetical protein